ncbi:MAG: type VII toxin-antitoxin system HepT family RNase toxin [Candidatus Nanoarchaeia archaeon]
MKLREEVIKSKIRNVIDLVEIINEHLPKAFEDFNKSRMVRDAVYKETESAIEYLIDICNIINTDLGLGMPESEESILNNLKKKKILPLKIINLIKDMKNFRNILVHKYGEIDDEQAFDTIKQGIDDFNKVISEIESFLDKHQIDNS